MAHSVLQRPVVQLVTLLWSGRDVSAASLSKLLHLNSCFSPVLLSLGSLAVQKCCCWCLLWFGCLLTRSPATAGAEQRTWLPSHHVLSVTARFQDLEL